MSHYLLSIVLAALAGGGVVGLAVVVWRPRKPRGDSPTSAPANSSEPDAPASVQSDPLADEQSSARTNVLLATMSHEIRTPLNGVLGMLELLEGADLTGEQRGIVQTIVDSGQLLSGVVDDYLSYYRLESGEGFAVNPGACKLDDVVLQSMLLYQGLARDKGLGFTFVSDSDTPHVVHTDAARLRQVVGNLIINAIKYTSSGEVCVAIEQAANYTDISVSDTGPGLDDDDIDGLFEPFHRVDASSGHEKGAGLGLAIARRLTAVLGGELQVDSEAGVGTTFTLRFDFEVLVDSAPAPPELPYQTAVVVGGLASASMVLVDLLEGFGVQTRLVEQADRLSDQPADLGFVFSGNDDRAARRRIDRLGAVRIDIRWLGEPQAHGDDADENVLVQPFSRATLQHTLCELAAGARRTSTVDRWRTSMAESYPLSILVAEDDQTSARVIDGILGRLGYSPTVVSSGPQAIEGLSLHEFDLALLDLNLPGFGGIEILRRTRPAATWWVAMSASAQPEQRRQCRDAGFRDFLAKPLSVGAIRSALVRGSSRDSQLIDSQTATASIDQMRELFSESPRAYGDLLESHIAQTDLLCRDIERGLVPGGDPETARRAAHTIQGGAGSFGCERAAHFAGTLDVEWDTLSHDRRRQVAERLIDAWRNDERAQVKQELASLGI